MACIAGLLGPFGLPARALAQSCSPDASLSCADDAGADDAGHEVKEIDGGSVPDPKPRPACSCTTDEGSPGNRIHVCTGSHDAEVCRHLVCERGVLSATTCNDVNVSLCCAMPERGLYSQLYYECERSSCSSGFIAQCVHLGGELRTQACEGQQGHAIGLGPARYNGGSAPACSVRPVRAGVGARHALGLGFAAVLMLASLVRLRSRRKLHRKRPRCGC